MLELVGSILHLFPNGVRRLSDKMATRSKTRVAVSYDSHSDTSASEDENDSKEESKYTLEQNSVLVIIKSQRSVVRADVIICGQVWFER